MRSKICLLALVMIVGGGCSISRLIPTIRGESKFTEADHWGFVQLAGANPKSTNPLGADAYAQAFVLFVDEGVLDGVRGSYRYGWSETGTTHELKVIHSERQRAVLAPTDHVGKISGTITRMKEGRYLLYLSYRVNGRDYSRRCKVEYLRKVDWGVETIKLPK